MPARTTLTTANCKSAAIGDWLIALQLPPSPVIVRSMRDWLVLMAHLIERLIGTLRREYLDQIFFWNGLDLHRKLDRFAAYYNQRRVHAGLGGKTPFELYATTACQSANLHHFAWRSDCSGLFHTPIAA
jgi:integrase-like protein